jgi:hypothetical protein
MLNLVLIISASISAEPIQAVLINRADNINQEKWSLSSKDAGTSSKTPWKITKTRLHGGKQEGVDIVEIDNGRLRIVVVPTRGMGIWSVHDGDVRIGWDSPVKEIVHPSLVSLPSRGGLGWLDGFGEFLCRCGLENNGHPGKDTIKDNTGAESSTDLTLHGKQAYLPAEHVEVKIDRDAPHTIRLKGIVPERMMHGPKFRLETEISTDPDSPAFRIKDRIVNESASPTEYQILYHTNFGTPLLEEGSECLVAARKVIPFNERAAEGDVKQYATFAGPSAGFVEQVFCIEPYSDSNGQTIAALVNKAKNRAVSINYQTGDLPFLTLWKNTTSIEDGYVTGIEPGTNYPYNRNLERRAGRVPKFAGKESKEIELEFTIHSNEGEVRQLTSAIAAIKANRPCDIATRPNPPKEE